MKKSKQLNTKRESRKRRVRARIAGTAEKPRLSVHRSNTHIYAQLIDDAKRKTIVSASSLEIRQGTKKIVKSEIAKLVGAELAKKGKAAGIKTAVFDRGSYRYHGRVKALAEAAREGGIHF